MVALYPIFTSAKAVFHEKGGVGKKSLVSRWTFQAERSDGHLFNFVIKPDQMQVVNPLMILVLIPAFDRLVYPFFYRRGLLKDPIHR